MAGSCVTTLEVDFYTAVDNLIVLFICALNTHKGGFTVKLKTRCGTSWAGTSKGPDMSFKKERPASPTSFVRKLLF